MNALLETDWEGANQRLLGAEFEHLRALLGDGDPGETLARVRALRADMPAAAAVDTLVNLFGLSGFERALLLLAAGIEMDARLAAACAQAGDRSGPWASFGLALAVLPDAHWSAIAPVEPLRRWRLIELDESGGITAGRLRIDERILHFLAGLNYLDHRLAGLCTRLPPAGLMADAHRTAAVQAVARLRARPGRLPTVLLSGDDPEGQHDVAEVIAEQLGLAMFAVRAADIPAAAHEAAALATLWQREAALLGAGLLISGADEVEEVRLTRLLRQIDGLVVIAGRTPVRLDGQRLPLVIDRTDPPAQRRLWQAALGERAGALDAVVESLAGHYRLGAGEIARVAAEVEGHDPGQYGAALRRLSRGDGGRLADLAQAIEARANWDDLVLPDSQLHTLGQIAVHARHRARVHHDWGFAAKGTRGLGIATLFAGESGTGKTLAAEVLANALGHTLYRIDLSAVVSKYIGETEKNLRRVFDAAEEVGAILLFDEADALFGKRSEVKDSHDRYANIEVSYLLQRMEAYRGLAILTTNHKAALDGAFQRRLRFVVHFPFPDAAQREAIWRTVFPPDTPLDGLDYAKLARLNATGGGIRNIALNAAFLAAEEGTPVGMAQLRRAALLEAAKREKPLSDAETRGWV